MGELTSTNLIVAGGEEQQARDTRKKMLLKSFCTSQFPHESVDLLFILVMEKEKLTALWGG